MKKNLILFSIVFCFIIVFTVAVVHGKNRKPSECINYCGDGTCEEIVCMGAGCPCPETYKTCPLDCPE